MARCYTEAELALVRALWPTHTAAQIAEHLHGTRRSAQAVYRLAYVLGLCKQPRHPDELLTHVRELSSAGLPDRLVARQLGLSHDQAKHLRKRLGLPTVPDLEAKRASVARQRATLGISTAGQLRSLVHRNYAVENGWPAELRPREVQILNVLAAAGVPLSKLQLCRAIGMPEGQAFRSGKRRILLASNSAGGTYTASLARSGLITRLKRALPGRGKGRSYDLYVLGPTALIILQRRALCEMPTDATPTPSG